MLYVKQVFFQESANDIIHKYSKIHILKYINYFLIVTFICFLIISRVQQVGQIHIYKNPTLNHC